MNSSEAKKQNTANVKIQDFGRFLSGMVMPNIGAFIAWGLITAFFIETGWIPNEKLASLVGPMITYLLPLLIGYTGGKMVGDIRGGVVGAVATMGVIVGADIPMFLGAMVVGPLGGYVIKKFDLAIEGKIKTGFEMLVNNFSAGIIGMLLAILAYLGIGPLVLSLTNGLTNAVESIVRVGLLPLVSLIIEPAKILFLNNAINHGVLGPIGVQEVKEFGKSIFFLIETNPGPGLGILLAYWAFGRESVKQSAPGAVIIHFFGGIHEIYFPYVLMNPILILAVIAGGASGVFVFNLFNAGLVATPSPGSIFALLAMTPKGSFLGVLLGVLISTGVSFFLASIFVKSSSKAFDKDELDKATERMAELKNKNRESIVLDGEVNKIVFACDAGMGSSAMGASLLRDKVKKAGIDIDVVNCAIESIPDDGDIIITHKGLTQRAIEKAPNKRHISIEDFLNTPVYGELIEELKERDLPKKKPINKERLSQGEGILEKRNIKVGLKNHKKADAIDLAGELLFKSGYVSEEYTEAMHRREEVLSTYIGNGVAIPHGDKISKDKIKKSGIVVLQYPEGIDYGNGDIAYLVIGIAGRDKEHLNILSDLANILEDKEIVDKLIKTKDSNEIYNYIMK